MDMPEKAAPEIVPESTSETATGTATETVPGSASGSASGSVPAAGSAARLSRLLLFRLAGAFLAGIPLFCTMPYMVYSWRWSPMDKMDWLFFLAFLPVAACAAPAVLDSAKQNKYDWFALAGAAAAAVLYATGIAKDIYMIRILAGIWFWWTGVWFFCGWKAAWATIPAFATLSLGCTSTTFLISRHLLIQPRTALFLKLGAAVLCAGVCAVVTFTDYVMKREVFWFLLAAAAILTGTLTMRGQGKTAPAFRPDLSASVPGFTTAETPLSENTVRFFEGAEVHQYTVANDFLRASVLVVKCADDIHKIHPASHCLRSSGASILSESVVAHTLPDGRSLPVTEIRSRIRGVPALTFVWYTGPKETVGSFYAFRRKWSPSDQWYSYQVVTEIHDGNEDAARKFLLDLLSKY